MSFGNSIFAVYPLDAVVDVLDLRSSRSGHNVISTIYSIV